MSGQALPRSLNISQQKPPAVSAYRRRFRTLSTSANEYLPGATVKIPLDTSMHGSLMDTKTMRLEYSVRVKNSNPYVDFTDLGPIGWNAVIKSFRVVVNGNPIENNLQYATSMADTMNKMGLNQEPYEIFRENLYIPGADKGAGVNGHINLVKPCMVDVLGRPMHAKKILHDAATGNFIGPDDTQDGSSGKAAYRTAPTIIGIANTDQFQGEHLAGTGSTVSGVQLNVTLAGALLDGTTAFALNGDMSGVSRMTSKFTKSMAHETIQNNHKDANNLDTNFGPDYHTPVSWPFYQPNRQCEAKRDHIPSSRWADILSYYSNVKNIPIGVRKYSGGSDFNHDSYTIGTTSQKTSYAEAITEYKVSSWLLSGVLGTLSSKMFPDMLAQVGTMWIELDLNDARRVLQVSMDPCRVVPGSHRGWVPYTGRKSGMALTTAALTSANTYPYLHKYQCICPDGAALEVTDNSTVPVDSMTMFSDRAAVGLHGNYHQIVQGGTNNDSVAKTTGAAILNGAVGVGVPQYVPCDSTWYRWHETATTAAAVVRTYVPERVACFGTYRKAACAQSRRTLRETNPAFWSSTGSGATTYSVINVELVGEQILLPTSVTEEVISGVASSGSISIHTSMIQASYNNAPAATTQNLNLPVTGASVNNLTFLFQSDAQLNQAVSMAYDSFAFYNPYAKLTYNRIGSGSTSTERDVGGSYVMVNHFNSNQRNNLELQLQVGTELYPRQPIQTLPELLQETEKGLHSIGDSSWKTPFISDLCEPVNTNLSVGAYSYLDYSPFMQGYTAAFIEIDALDDQTITGNPHFLIVDKVRAASEDPVVGIRGRREPKSYTAGDTIHGSLNQYKPSEGKFFLCFDMDTFQNQGEVARSGKHFTIFYNDCIL